MDEASSEQRHSQVCKLTFASTSLTLPHALDFPPVALACRRSVRNMAALWAKEIRSSSKASWALPFRSDTSCWTKEVKPNFSERARPRRDGRGRRIASGKRFGALMAPSRPPLPRIPSSSSNIPSSSIQASSSSRWFPPSPWASSAWSSKYPGFSSSAAATWASRLISSSLSSASEVKRDNQFVSFRNSPTKSIDGKTVAVVFKNEIIRRWSRSCWLLIFSFSESGILLLFRRCFHRLYLLIQVRGTYQYQIQIILLLLLNLDTFREPWNRIRWLRVAFGLLHQCCFDCFCRRRCNSRFSLSGLGLT